MGLTKQYLAYHQCGTFNIVVSGRSNINFVPFKGDDGRYVAVAGAEKIIIWDMRLSEKVIELTRGKEEVTALRACPDEIHLAVGYVDGVVEIYNLKEQRCVTSMSLHKTAVSVLRYDEMGMKLASGGLDTELFVCDVLSEVGTHRLSGHTGPVTDAWFYEKAGHSILISSSKDTHIKFWNLETQACFKTLVDHRSDVWGMALMRNAEFLVTGSGDHQLTVYRLKENDGYVQSGTTATMISDEAEDSSLSPITANLIGAIQRAGRGRTVTLVTDPTGKVLACHGTDDQIELFYICDEEEAAARLTKRLKKLSVAERAANKDVTLTDEIKRLTSIKTTSKLKSLDLLIGGDEEIRVLASFADNLLRMFSFNLKQKGVEPKRLRAITQPGHHSEVRCVSFSSDNMAIASGSGESLKLWNRHSMKCLRTIEGIGYALCCCFVPGDRHVLVGLKTGHLVIADVVTGDILEQITAHDTELTSICLLPDLKHCASGGGDKTVKIWAFELITDPTNETGNKVLSLLHKNTLQLDETVTAVKISPNGKFIAVALLDSTVKIFFLDTMKFYLSLYGHKLPVISMDISYDSSLIATGSADRNLKIWGMDFGDCHRSLFAHDDSVMGVQFVPKTHLIFTCGKDGKIKQWDGDSFEKIITLPGHIGHAYSLAASPSGEFLVSCGSDRVLRLFERTDEPIVLQDVQEEEREEVENRILATGEESVVPGLPHFKMPSKKTVGSEKAADSILECLEICTAFDANPSSKDLHPLMQAFNVENSVDFIIVTLERIRPSDLEEALILVPFSSVCILLGKMEKLLESRKDQMELLCKVALFLFQIHQKPIVSNQTLYPVIGKIIEKLSSGIVELRDLFGTNSHALQLIQRDVEESEGVELFWEASASKTSRDKKRKKRELTKRIAVQMN